MQQQLPVLQPILYLKDKGVSSNSLVKFKVSSFHFNLSFLFIEQK